MGTQPTGEMDERNLLKIADLFFKNGNWETQTRFRYDKENKRRFYKVDCYSLKYKTIWEYEGPDHYEDVWKLRRDNDRESYFLNNGYKFLRWPYYCQLTKDIAKHYFGDQYNEKTYLEAIRHVYGVEKEKFILAPGFHTTKNTPANYVPGGTRRFLEELNSFPKTLKCQVVHSLKLYITGVDDPSLVIGEGPEYQDLLDTDYQKHVVNLYYSREN